MVKPNLLVHFKKENYSHILYSETNQQLWLGFYWDQEEQVYTLNNFDFDEDEWNSYPINNQFF